MGERREDGLEEGKRLFWEGAERTEHQQGLPRQEAFHSRMEGGPLEGHWRAIRRGLGALSRRMKENAL